MYRYKIKILNVINADLFEVDIDLGFNNHFVTCIQLYGIDTPLPTGKHRALGLQAKEFVNSWLEEHQDKQLTIDVVEKVRTNYYDNYWCELYAIGDIVSLNEKLIELGWGSI